MSDVAADTARESIRVAKDALENVRREYDALRAPVPKQTRIERLRAWNDAASSYFTKVTDACVGRTPVREYQTGAWAVDWLKEVIDHYAAIKREIETRKLGIDFESLKPGPMKFTELQRFVKAREPLAARDLQRDFMSVGLPTYGFEDVSSADAREEAREGLRWRDHTRERLRWFVFGCVFSAVAIAFAGWGFYLVDLSPSQRLILVWLLPISSGFAAGAFAGSIDARARHWGPGFFISASGGFAVWLITTYILFPQPAGSSGNDNPGPAGARVSYRLQVNGQPAVSGDKFALDLGYIEAERPLDVDLAVGLQSGHGAFTVGSASGDVSLIAPSEGQQIQLTANRSIHISIRLNRETPQGTTQVREIQLLSPTSADDAGHSPLVLRVQWNALPSTVTRTARSGSRPSGSGKDFSPPYEVCADAPTEGNYVLDSGTSSLSGDRVCGSYSTCTERQDEKQYCLVFTLQGHEECQKFGSQCDAVRSSEGQVKAVFKLKPSTPTLTSS